MKSHPIISKDHVGTTILAIIAFIFIVPTMLLAGQTPKIDYKDKMSTGECQNLEITNAREGVSYTFELIGGSGTVDGPTYCAPASMEDCGDTPTILVTDSEGMEKTITIGLITPGTEGLFHMKMATPGCTWEGCESPGCVVGCCYDVQNINCAGEVTASSKAGCKYNPNDGDETNDCSASCDGTAQQLSIYPIFSETPCCPGGGSGGGGGGGGDGDGDPPGDNGQPPSTGPDSGTGGGGGPGGGGGDGDGDGEDGCKDKEGNPISILDGSKQERQTDLSFAGPGTSLTFTRFYNSLHGVETALGHGWNHTYGASLQTDTTHGFDLKIKDIDGHGFYFRMTSPTGYTGMFTESSTVTYDGNGYTWHRDSGSRYLFNANGRLVSITDVSGNQKSLTYDAQDRLETVTDAASGRNLTFEYDGNDRLYRVFGPVTSAVPDGKWSEYNYDVNGNLTDVIYPDGTGFSYSYSDINFPHHLTEKQDRTGRILASWAHDEQGRAVSVMTIDGKDLTIAYGEGVDDNKVTVTDADGIIKTYTITRVDGLKRVLKVEYENACSSCGNSARRYSYDDNYNIIQKIYANGRVDQFFEHDHRGNASEVVLAVGSMEERTIYKTFHPYVNKVLSRTESSVLGLGDKVTIWDYDDDGNDTPNENPTLYVHRRIERGFTLDAGNNVVPFEYITVFEYNGRGQVTLIDGSLPGDQDQQTFSYDPVTGDLISKTAPLVGTTSYGYDAAGNLTSVTDINGVVTTMTYDGRNRPLTTIKNGITISIRTYTADGNLDTTTDANGRMLDYDYTAEGFLERITGPKGNFILHAYDDRGRKIATSLHTVGSQETHFRGFDYGDPVTNPDLSPGKPWKTFHRNHDNTADLATVYAYDSAGNPASVTDANDNLTAYTYDLFNRLIQVEQPATTITQYAYDAHGNLTSVTDAEGHITDYTYDDLGRLVETVSPDTGTTQYLYDAAGRMNQKTQNGNTTSYTYDDLGRLTDVLYADTSENVIYTYDSGSGSYLVGRLASKTDEAGVFSYSYDAYGRLVSQTRLVDTLAFTTSYTYDDAGNLRSMTYPTGHTIVYDADATDPALIAGVRLDPAGSNQILASGISYRPFGPMDGLTFGNGAVLAKTFDLNYQVDTLTVAGVLERDYTPDNVGNITDISDALDPTRSQQFGYDELYRLTSANGIYSAIGFTYDKVGNRLTRTDAAGTDTYAYINGTNKLRSVSGPNAKSYSYDDDGYVIAALGGQQPPLVNQADYTYNSNGQRVKKTADAQSVVLHFDKSGQLIAETDEVGALIKAYVWLHGQPLAMIAADGGVYYYHNDHLGTPQKLTNSTANEVWAADYLPFGEVDVIVSTVENNLRSAGQYYDSETGLHYNYHRYYDPNIGRYLRPDPIHQMYPEEMGIPFLINGLLHVPLEMHLFAYTSNNPMNLTDPLGQSPQGPELPTPDFAKCVKEVNKKYKDLMEEIYNEHKSCLEDCTKTDEDLRKIHCGKDWVLDKLYSPICEMQCSIETHINSIKKKTFYYNLELWRCRLLYQGNNLP